MRKSRAETDIRRHIALVENRRQWTALAILMALLLLLPHLLRWIGAGGWLMFTNFTLLTVVAVLGLNVITGMCGLISLGHSGFIMLGSYGVAILTVQLGWPFWAALAVSTPATAAVAAIVALPAVRLKGFYVAVVTLAFFFIAQYVFKNLPLAGSFHGLVGVPPPRLFGWKVRTETAWYYLFFAAAVLSVLASANIARSRFGRAFCAVRDNSVTAAGLGIHVGLAKIRAFFLGGLFAGLAGGLWAAYVSVVRLDQFSLWDSIWYVGMIIIGGGGSTAGAVAGVVLLRLLGQILRTATMGGWLPLNSNAVAALTYAVYGLAIVLFAMFQPHGLMAIWGKLRARYKSWPFGV